MNQPDRYERFVLPEHKKKLEFSADTKIENAGTYTVEREDHTLGNLVRMQLHRDEQVLFSGYRIPHPLEPKMLIKVQTTGDKPPQAAFAQSLDYLITEVDDIRDQMLKGIQEEEAKGPGGGLERRDSVMGDAGQQHYGGGGGGY